MDRRIVQVTTLGQYGRFGNQLFQYVFARSYAEMFGAVLEVPQWDGEKLFGGVRHPRPSITLPRTRPDDVPWGQVNIDLCGYFQTSKCFSIISKTSVSKWLSFNSDIVEYYKGVRPAIAAHIRRGDYVKTHSKHYCIVTKQSYVKACHRLGLHISDISWVCEEEPRVDTFSAGLGVTWLPDFMGMVNASVLLRSNSTFSFWAGFFSRGRVCSPIVGSLTGKHTVPFTEGNDEPICTMTDRIVFKD